MELDDALPEDDRVSTPDSARLRPLGLSAFVRCKDEEEYVVASLLSVHRFCDEIVVILNNCTDRTPDLVAALAEKSDKIRVLHYDQECAPAGLGYAQHVARKPASSLARYYNWCLEQTRFSHVCKWDADMIATQELERARALISTADVVMFDGYDVLGQKTTDLEARIFRYHQAHARYVDWELYEVLQHKYDRVAMVSTKTYLHMKLAKRSWLDRPWQNPNDAATSAYPAPSAGEPARRTVLLRMWDRVRRRLGRVRWGRRDARRRARSRRASEPREP
ncbi:MAG: glycosyltransferase [Planctomycetes bacterium]|nr:glycosyltransferase [Myxococcales bacterium]MCB9828365.1 glycosyltransferase [Planctomycetota bacterium]